MEGYDVVANDEQKIGHVAGIENGFVIVEHGTVFKSKHAVPEAVVHVDEEERVARLSVSREILEEGPKVEDDGFDEQAVADYYGLAGDSAAPETEGYGDLAPDETARSSEVQATPDGVDPAERERAEVRSSLRSETQKPPGESPGLLGDRHG